MKYADKLDARYSMVLGDNELQRNTATLKNMRTGETTEIQLSNLNAIANILKLD
jgi:histidyl-tRNA synthetase